MKFIVQKTKRSCVSVAVYNAFVYWGYTKPNVNQLRHELRECKENGGVLWKDLRRWLFRNKLTNVKHFDKDLKFWTNPLSVCFVALDYKGSSHCVIVRKIDDNFVWLINEDKKNNWKINYKMAKSKFQKKLLFYMIINPA
jgi:hypothetical protein